MTAVTNLIEISSSDIPQSKLSGTGIKRRAYIVKYNAAALAMTLDLASYDKILTGVESVRTININGALPPGYVSALGTVTTFSGTTLTTNLIGTAVVEVIGYYS